ncbi:TPA: hypothetical protein TXL49_001982 [Streptococcus suis]|nr:hypothetical protein [Streptococcus suis]HEL1607913.1 hypothetical protein [Streptococcus suis]HEM2728252.1 hypothetical protein [Streptococcus suis]
MTQEELEKIVKENIMKFLASDYGRGFIDGIQTMVDVISKKMSDINEISDNTG